MGQQKVLDLVKEDLANFKISAVTPLYRLEDKTKLEAVGLEINAPDSVYHLTADVGRPIASYIAQQIPTCRILDPKKGAVIDARIIKLATKSESGGLFCRNFGLHKLFNGSWIFLAGNEVLGDCGEYAIKFRSEVSVAHLASDKSADEKAAIIRLVDEIGKNQRTIWPTFVYTLLSSVRSAIMRLGLTTFPALYLVGRQRYGKTMLALRYNLLYDDAKNQVMWGKLESNGTPKGIMKAISHYRDQVTLVDDLAISSDPSVQRERFKLISEILRFAANGNTRVTAAASFNTASQACQAGVVFTGEIPLTAGSDLTRLIEVPLTKPMTGGIESDRAGAATVFRAWMLWLLPHLDDELSNLKHQLGKLDGGEDARLETIKVLLLWTNELFYRFARDKNVVADTYYATALQAANKTFTRLLDAQAQKVQLVEDVAPKGNLSWYILNGYRANRFHIVASRKKLKDEADCVIEKEALCIRTGTLLTYLQSQSNVFLGLTDKMMLKKLREEGVLADTAEHRSAKKKINRKRYLELDIGTLKASAKQY